MPSSRPPSGAELPYWDSYLRQLQAAGLPADVRALHSHYGCWDDPSWSNRVPADYGRAAQRMCDKVLAAAGVADGQRLLDVGCGLGAVVASLNERLSGMTLWGLNVDERQLAIARRVCNPANHNIIEFIAGDAVRLPFDGASFDVLLALECSMHFSSRERFLAEAARVLRPSGRLALCEHFSQRPRSEPADQPRQSRLWGTFQEPLSVSQFQALAARHGLKPVHCEDVTRATIPTFPGVRQFVCAGLQWPLNWQARLMLRLTELLLRMGRLRYCVLAFERQ